MGIAAFDSSAGLILKPTHHVLLSNVPVLSFNFSARNERVLQEEMALMIK
jgi:hypothetical protein